MMQIPYVIDHDAANYISRKYDELDWSINVNTITYLPEIYPTFKQWLGNSDALNVLVHGGPQTINAVCECLCDWEQQFKCGFPIPLRLVCAFCDPIYTEEGAKSVNAVHRLHRFMLPYHYIKDQRWKHDHIIIRGYQRQMERYHESLRDRYSFLNIPKIFYGNADSAEGKEYLAQAAHERISQGKRPFDMIISGPNGFWVPRWMRLLTGEISIPSRQDEKNISSKGVKSKFDLVPLEIYERVYYTYGFAWGIHPVGSAGDHFAYSEFIGKDPIKLFVENKLMSGCLALMGLGGSTMDDRRLLDITSGSEAFGLDYKENDSDENLHRLCQSIANWCGEQVPHLLFGDFTSRYETLGSAIAKRIKVLFGPQAAHLRARYYK